MTSIPENLLELARDARAVMQGCVLEGATLTLCEHGTQSMEIAPGGSLTTGHVILRDGVELRALDGGGFRISAPCEDCEQTGGGS